MGKFILNEDNVDNGIMLEMAYKKKLLDALRSSGAEDPQSAAGIIVGDDHDNMELGGLEKKPVFEELNAIPMGEQLDLIRKRLKMPKEEYYIDGLSGERTV